jgi:hypothetical protein
MPAIAGKEAVAWIDEYVEKKGPKLILVAEGLRRLMKKTVAGVKEFVNPWKIPTFESNGPLCFFMGERIMGRWIFARNGAAGPEGIARGDGEEFAAREVALGGGFERPELKKPELKKLIVEAVKRNRKEPMEGMQVKRM